jgi:hypothetical protein
MVEIQELLPKMGRTSGGVVPKERRGKLFSQWRQGL